MGSNCRRLNSLCRTAVTATLACLLAAAATTVGAEELRVPIADPGSPVTLEASIMQGTISVEAYDGSEVLLQWQEEREDEGEVVERSSEGLYRIPNRSFGLSAEADGNHVTISSGWHGSELQVLVRVPVRTSVELSSVNCDSVSIRGVSGEHELSCINGEVEAIDVAGSVVAQSNNGDVTVVFTEADAGKAMSFVTFNGDIDVTFPAGYGADLRMSSLQGEIYGDSELEILPSEPTVDRDESKYHVRIEREVHARLGGGGADVRFKTFNGDIRVRRP